MPDPVPPSAPSAIPPVIGSTLPSSAPSATPAAVPPTLQTLPPPSSSPPGSQDETSGIDGFFDDLSQQILVASHNGLFNVVNLLYKNRIDELMSAASESQTKRENEKFGAQVYEMRRIFDEAWNKAPRSWRILYERGMFHFLAIFASAYITFYCLVALEPFLEPRIPIWICGFGVCGASLQIIYYLIKQINRRLLRRVWIVQCFFAPVLGVLLSIAIYLAINGGLMVFGADKDKSSLNENIIALFCLYAGYKWEWALDKLNELIGVGKQR